MFIDKTRLASHVKRKVNVVELNQFSGLATRNPTARAVFEAVAEQTRFRRELLLDTLVQQTNGERRDIVKVLRELETMRAGRLIVGRRKQKTRFAWTDQFDVVATLKKALLLSPKGAVAPAPDPLPDQAGLLRHRYLLRPAFEVELGLPADLSVREAERLADFIKTLPFGGPV
jgi:hypothetical protein